MGNALRKTDRDDELELLAAILAGKRACWSEFKRRYERLIASCVLLTLRRYDAPFSQADLQDLIAEVWLDLWRDDLKKLRAFEPARGLRLSNWIALISTRTTIDRLRTQRAEFVLRERLTNVESTSSAAQEPDEDAMVNERSRLGRGGPPPLSLARPA